MLALPAGITMVIILAAVHALMPPNRGPLLADNAGNQVTPPSSAPPVTAATPGVSPTPGPMPFPLPSQVTTARPSVPPAPAPAPSLPPPSAAARDDGPVPGAYHMKSLNGACFDIGYTSDQTPMVAQKACSAGGPMVRFDLEALGSGRYRMTAVPQRGINAGSALCLSSTGTDRMMMLDGCENARDDQVLVFTETSQDWYQITAGGACVTAAGRDARVRACGNSQAQRFTFEPIS